MPWETLVKIGVTLAYALGEVGAIIIIIFSYLAYALNHIVQNRNCLAKKSWRAWRSEKSLIDEANNGALDGARNDNDCRP